MRPIRPPEVVHLEVAELACEPEPSPYCARAPPEHRNKFLYTIRCKIRSGQNHIIKRLLSSVGLPPIRRLHREQFGDLKLDMIRNLAGNPLALGEFVELNATEVDLAGSPDQEILNELRKCRLLCRYRADLLQGRSDFRLKTWLLEHHTLDGPCYAKFPSLKVDCSAHNDIIIIIIVYLLTFPCTLPAHKTI